MDQPIYWGVLAATAIVLAGARLVARRPLWRSRSRAVSRGDLVVAAAAVAVLVFHCMAMFFADWVDAVPFAEAPAAAVRDLDSLASEVSYWVPAVALIIALRQVWVWPPAVALLVVTLGGVGYTMFVPHALTTHLAWLAAAVVTLVLLGTALVSSSVPRGSVSSARL